jgi:hypothetical protein
MNIKHFKQKLMNPLLITFQMIPGYQFFINISYFIK